MASGLKNFYVEGPVNIPIVKRRAARTLADNPNSLWDNHPNLSNRHGVYIFAIRAAGGYKPFYVGKAGKTDFAKEIFNTRNRNTINKALADCLKGKPVVFFIVHPRARGGTNQELIKQVEQYFIDVAYAKNQDLYNVQGKTKYGWGVTGVIRSIPGPPSKAAKEFRKVIK